MPFRKGRIALFQHGKSASANFGGHIMPEGFIAESVQMSGALPGPGAMGLRLEWTGHPSDRCVIMRTAGSGRTRSDFELVE